MSTSVPPLDGGTGTSGSPNAVLSDEDALHRTFLAEYPALAAEAKAELGTEAAALCPKVVEGAFVRAWDARTRFQTPAQLHQFLVEDVHHAAARALSRRAAAHRMGTIDPHATAHAGHGSVELDPETSWSHIQHALHGEAHSPETLARAAAVSRHEAASHIVVATKNAPPWAAIGLGLLALAFVVGLVFFVEHLGKDSKIANAVNAADARVVTSNPAQVGNVTLDDGTKVHLAPESKLSIPKTFGPKLRAVKIEGAATFDVAKGQELEFRAFARDVAVVATGTSFTVRAYPSDEAVTIVVGEGSVEVRRAKETQTLGAGQSLVLREGETPRAATAEERDAADAWRGGTLAIAGQPLREVLPQLKRWYGLDVRVQQPPLLERKVTLRASLDSSRQAIRGIEQSTGLEFGYMGQTMVFKERAAKASGSKKRK